MTPKRSQLCLEIQLPLEAGQPVFFRTGGGESWTHHPDPLDGTLGTAAIWDRIVQDWDQRRNLLTEAGAKLGL